MYDKSKIIIPTSIIQNIGNTYYIILYYIMSTILKLCSKGSQRTFWVVKGKYYIILQAFLYSFTIVIAKQCYYYNFIIKYILTFSLIRIIQTEFCINDSSDLSHCDRPIVQVGTRLYTIRFMNYVQSQVYVDSETLLKV